MPRQTRKHRHVELDRAADERDLGSVALRDRAVGRRVRIGAVQRRVDVVPAGEHQPIDVVKGLVRVRVSSGSGGIISASPPARWIASM